MSAKIQISNTTQPSAPPAPLDPAKLEFGKTCSPNFFVMDYRNGEWVNARIQPVEPFKMHPVTSVLHYAQTIFEGMKAYRHDDGAIALFRPEMNAKRFRVTADRMMIPLIDETFFVEAVSALVENERYWVPPAPGCFYIRPTAMGVDEALGVKSASNFLFYILTLPSGPYFPGTGLGPKAIDVFLSQSVARSAPGLTGNVKAGANYAGTLKITDHAKHLGCAQVLFLDAIQHQYVEEMGGMNVMFVQGNTLRTPPLAGTILNGVTRASLLQLGKDMGMDVSEAPITIDEVRAGARDGSIGEMLACGTAAVVMAIKSLKVEDGTTITFSEAPGKVTSALYEALVGVQYGRLPDKHGWIRKVCRVEAAAAR